MMLLVFPAKFCIAIVFDFSSNDCNTQEKLETTMMQNWGGGGGKKGELGAIRKGGGGGGG